MVLYKYVPPERIDALRSGLIRYTPLVEFNDPFESSPVLTGFDQEQIERVSKVEAAEAGISEEVRIAIMKRTKDPDFFQASARMMMWLMGSLVGALSLSERRDSLLMWAHYTAQHTGFVIGFDVDDPAWVELQRQRGPKRIDLQKVEYAKQRPTRAKLSELRGDDFWYTKSSDWAYEQEWRITETLDRADVVLGESKIHLFRFRRNACEK